MTFLDRLNVIAQKLGAEASNRTIQEALVSIEAKLEDRAKVSEKVQQEPKKQQKPKFTEKTTTETDTEE